MPDKLVRALRRVVVVLVVALAVVIASPAWVVVLARFDDHPVSAGFAVLANLVTIAFFGVNTALFALSAGAAVRTSTTEAPQKRETRVVTAVIGAMTVVMSVGTVLAAIVLVTLLTSSSASLAPWSGP
ncbi:MULTISPECIES: hypothetical protein [Gordonia]|uniref:hypothetical protein n=1 Tax=Gordonia TaxID=2053 RepID=UPI00339AE4D1